MSVFQATEAQQQLSRNTLHVAFVYSLQWSPPGLLQWSIPDLLQLPIAPACARVCCHAGSITPGVAILNQYETAQAL